MGKELLCMGRPLPTNEIKKEATHGRVEYTGRMAFELPHAAHRLVRVTAEVGARSHLIYDIARTRDERADSPYVDRRYLMSLYCGRGEQRPYDCVHPHADPRRAVILCHDWPLELFGNRVPSLMVIYERDLVDEMVDDSDTPLGRGLQMYDLEFNGYQVKQKRKSSPVEDLDHRIDALAYGNYGVPSDFYERHVKPIIDRTFAMPAGEPNPGELKSSPEQHGRTRSMELNDMTVYDDDGRTPLLQDKELRSLAEQYNVVLEAGVTVDGPGIADWVCDYSRDYVQNMLRMGGEPEIEVNLHDGIEETWKALESMPKGVLDLTAHPGKYVVVFHWRGEKTRMKTEVYKDMPFGKMIEPLLDELLGKATFPVPKDPPPRRLEVGEPGWMDLYVVYVETGEDVPRVHSYDLDAGEVWHYATEEDHLRGRLRRITGEFRAEYRP